MRRISFIAWTIMSAALVAHGSEPAVASGGESPFARLWSAGFDGDRVAGCALTGAAVAVFSRSGEVQCLSLADGQLLSSSATGVDPASTPLIIGENAIIAGADGSLGCYNLTTGKQLWKSIDSASQASDPVLFDNAVWIGTGGTAPGLWRFDAQSGSGERLLTTEQAVLSPPAFCKGQAFIGTVDGQVIGLDLQTRRIMYRLASGGMLCGQRLLPVGSGLLLSPSGDYRRVECRSIAAPATALWSVSFERTVYADAMTYQTIAVQVPGLRDPMLRKALAESGDSGLAKSASAEDGFIATGPVHTSSWTVVGGRAAISVEEMGLPPWSLDHVVMVSTESGKALLHYVKKTAGSTAMDRVAPVIAGSTVIACVGSGTIVGLDARNGSELWSYDAGQEIAGPMLYLNGTLTVRTADSIFAFRTRPLPMLPMSFALFANFPNPFRSATVLRFAIPVACQVTLKVFDANGRSVVTLENSRRKAGYYAATWKGTTDQGQRAPAGVYLAKFKAGNFQKTIRMTLMR